MNIQGVGFGRQSSPIANRDLEQYDRQIKELQQKIKDTQSNDKMDDEQKEQLIQLYTQEIASLQAEKAQKAREQALERQERAGTSKQAEQQEVQQEENTGIIPIDEGVQKGFIQAQTAKDAATATAQVRVQKEGELRIASSDSYLREKADPATLRSMGDELAALQARETRVAGRGVDALKQAGGGAPVDSTKADDACAEAEQAEQARAGSGTGRMEPGQFLDDEA